MLLLAVTLGALGHVAVHLKQLEVGLALGRARKERAELLETRRKVELEIGVLKDPQRVASIAREKLGLRPPETGDIVALDRLAELRTAPPAARAGARPRPAAGAGEARTEGARP